MNIRTGLYRTIFCALGFAALGTVSASAQADGLPSKRVQFADLNVDSPEGAKTLYGRIRGAAKEVCALSIGSDPIERVAAHACIESAINKAVKEVNVPALTALRFGSSGDVRLASK
jgi:UrcA family protein